MSNAASQQSMAHEQPVMNAKDRLLSAIVNLQGLDRVEATVQSKLNSEAPILEEISSYLLHLGGKRIRPVMTLLCGRALGMQVASEQLIDIAAGIELIHMATLLHDDIIDDSPVRRHKESPLKKYGATPTLLAGDFLLVRAFSLCARLDAYIIDATERACIELTEGEVCETPLFAEPHTIETSVQIARKKTASLFRLAAESAAHLCQLPPAGIQAMTRFGEAIGIAFQMVDDILDVTADEDLLGKKSGMDLKERKPSIINVLWLQSGSPLAKRLLKKGGSDDEQFISEALSELRASSIVAEAQALARTHALGALSALDEALNYTTGSDAEAVASLRAVADYCLERLG